MDCFTDLDRFCCLLLCFLFKDISVEDMLKINDDLLIFGKTGFRFEKSSISDVFLERLFLTIEWFPTILLLILLIFFMRDPSILSGNIPAS